MQSQGPRVPFRNQMLPQNLCSICNIVHCSQILSYCFKLSNAIKANNADLEKIYSIEEATNFLERCDLTLAQMSVLKNAKLCELQNPDFKDNDFVRLYSQNIFSGIGIYNENHLFKEFLV